MPTPVSGHAHRLSHRCADSNSFPINRLRTLVTLLCTIRELISLFLNGIRALCKNMGCTLTIPILELVRRFSGTKRGSRQTRAEGCGLGGGEEEGVVGGVAERHGVPAGLH